jgi:hypothetical protein
MWEREDSQEVGSEAAILKRVRNSSLVEWSCADNVTGLKSIAEATDFHSAQVSMSKAACRGQCRNALESYRVGVVGERRSC